MNLIKYRKIYFTISLIVIIPGLIALLLWGLNPAIDFSGGSQLSFLYKGNYLNVKNNIQKVLNSEKIEIGTIEKSNNEIVLQTKVINDAKNRIIIADLKKINIIEDSFQTVGPIIGAETTKNAFYSVIFASILIVLYIWLAFREVPKPASSLRFGICAIIALLHDVLVVVGIFSILGHFWGVEVDSLFVTAILTVVGFSVHDTIVVFDRIRENLKKNLILDFDTVVNDSLLQTLGRSLKTSLTVILVLTSLLIFGSSSIRLFVVALLIGTISGTYSSIFNASQLLIVWNNWSKKRKK